MTSRQITAVRERAVAIARKNKGYGETTGNNRGKFITALGGKEGMEWCALYAGHPYRRAFELEGLEVPSWLFRAPGVAEPGALRLCQGLYRWEHGQLIWRPGYALQFLDYALPGDLALWRRTGGHHVGILDKKDDDGDWWVLEGNKGRFPARVKPFLHDFAAESHLRGIYGIR